MKQIKLFLITILCGISGLSIFAQHENLYIIGGPFNAHKNNWIFRDIVKLEKDNDNPAIFYYRGYIGYNTFGDERGKFKILTKSSFWEGYHPATEADQLIGLDQVGVSLAIRENGSDTKWYIPEDRSGDGYYVIKVDTENKTFLIESFTPATSAEFPVGLFLVGGPFIVDALGWNVDESIKIERDGTDPDVFHFRGYMERNQWGVDPGHFKVLNNAREWSDSFHPGGEDDVVLNSLIGENEGLSIRRRGADKKWYLPEDGSGNGYWDFTIDTKNMKIKVNEFIHNLDYFNEVYIAGDAMPNGWTGEQEVMTKTARGIYSWTGTVKSGGFKFLRTKGIFEGCYVATAENDAVTIGQANNIKYEKNYTKHNSGSDYKFVVNEKDANKKVIITIDLITNKMTVQDYEPTAIENSNLSPVNIVAGNGTVSINATERDNYSAHIYAVDGRKVSQETFESNTEINLPQGYYIVTVSNELGIIAKTKIVIL